MCTPPDTHRALRGCKAFCAALKGRFADPTSGLGKTHLRLLVDEIRLDGNELVVTGSQRHLADSIGFMEQRKLGEVPGYVNDWRARDDSNVRPLPSEGSTLSS